MKKGFTLIETLVVITIIGMIIGFALPRINSRQAKYNNTVNNIIDQLNMARQEASTKNIITQFFLSTDSFKYGNTVYRFPDKIFVYDYINDGVFTFASPIQFLPGGRADGVFAILVVDSIKLKESLIYVFPSGYVLKGTGE